jgi:hypothetical protein
MIPTYRPHKQVYVAQPHPGAEGGVYRYIGEVMSFPHGGTVMVRRVPGHPGTLEEMPLTRLEGTVPGRDRSNYVDYVEVASKFGRGDRLAAFPVDMLRYDSCAPVNFKLVENEVGSYNAVPDENFGFGNRLIVAKVTNSSRHGARWTERRWESFMWSIKRHIGCIPIGGDFPLEANDA